MFDAAIGPRLEASSLRMRRVFSAAGTFDVTFAGLESRAVAGAAASRRGAMLSAIFSSVIPAPEEVQSGIPYLIVHLSQGVGLQ
jgi:hypothetical protein